MAKIIKLKTFKDSRGSLTVIEDEIPFAVKRIFYIYDSGNGITRAGHRHKKNIQGLVCLKGAVVIENTNKTKEQFFLNKPDKCLILQPEDWHLIHFSDNAILMVFCSELYDENDYIFKKYEQSTNN